MGANPVQCAVGVATVAELSARADALLGLHDHSDTDDLLDDEYGLELQLPALVEF